MSTVYIKTHHPFTDDPIVAVFDVGPPDPRDHKYVEASFLHAEDLQGTMLPGFDLQHLEDQAIDKYYRDGGDRDDAADYADHVHDLLKGE